jgi:hypothetical protein
MAGDGVGVVGTGVGAAMLGGEGEGVGNDDAAKMRSGLADGRAAGAAPRLQPASRMAAAAAQARR